MENGGQQVVAEPHPEIGRRDPGSQSLELQLPDIWAAHIRAPVRRGERNIEVNMVRRGVACGHRANRRGGASRVLIVAISISKGLSYIEIGGLLWKNV